MQAIWIETDRELLIRAEFAEYVWLRDQLRENALVDVTFESVPNGAPGSAVARGRLISTDGDVLGVEVVADNQGTLSVMVAAPSLWGWLDELLSHNDASEINRPGWHAHVDVGSGVGLPPCDQLTFVGPTPD